MKTLSTLCAAAVALAGIPRSAIPQSGNAPGQDSRPAAAGVVPGVIDGEAAHKLVAGGIKVVDVRTPKEFQSGHVTGAVNIPYDEISHRYPELGPSPIPLLVYCTSGRRSGIAAATLRERGFTEIYDLQSYDRWVASEAAPAAR